MLKLCKDKKISSPIYVPINTHCMREYTINYYLPTYRNFQDASFHTSRDKFARRCSVNHGNAGVGSSASGWQ